MSDTKISKERAVLLYDGDCPICKRFARYLKVREHLEIVLTPMQEAPHIAKDLVSSWYDLNVGMILYLQWEIYQWDEALKVLEEYVELKMRSATPRYWRMVRYTWLRKGLYTAAKIFRLMTYWVRGKSWDLTHQLPRPSVKPDSGSIFLKRD